ncbi:hypothetical protein DRO97_01935 [Archaeoglobales archaeon]|nr:MAG: hypothetical protein DRO97_01935 [Archaeoglobales archaeon]
MVERKFSVWEVGFKKDELNEILNNIVRSTVYKKLRNLNTKTKKADLQRITVLTAINEINKFLKILDDNDKQQRKDKQLLQEVKQILQRYNGDRLISDILDEMKKELKEVNKQINTSNSPQPRLFTKK